MNKKRQLEILLKKKVKVSTILKYTSTLIALAILVFLYKRGVIAPLFINGEPIKFSEIITVVSTDSKSNYFDRLIAEKVILFEAKKRNIEVRKEEVEAEIYKIEKQAVENGITMVQLLKDRDTTLEEFQKNTKTRLILYKILAEDIDVTEDEIDDYILENAELFSDGEMELVRDEVKRILLDKKVSDVYGSWIRDAKASSEVRYIIDY